MSYRVDPEDVYVLDADGRSIEPPPGKVGAWLRRYRLRIALVVGVVEAIILWGWHHWFFGSLLALVIAITAVYAYVRYARNLKNQTLRQVAWIVAFSQGVAALIPAAIGFVAFSLVIFGVIALLVLLMILLGR